MRWRAWERGDVHWEPDSGRFLFLYNQRGHQVLRVIGVEAATGRVPRYIGKPNPEMIRMGLEKLGARPEETVMVGDRLYTDMEMAYRAGTLSALVLSGETTREQLAAAPRQPDFVFDSVADITRALGAQ